MSLRLSVIIVNYNGIAFLAECLDSITEHVKLPFEVIVVDNASHDGSPDFIRANYPDVKLIASDENLGFGKGNNLGAKYAQGDYLLLLNNDTRISSAVGPLVQYMKKHKETGILGCRLLNRDGSVQHSIGYYHTPLRLLAGWLMPSKFSWPSCLQLYEKNPLFYQKSHASVEWITGAFMLIRRDVWDELDGMDPAFFMYMEDVDFCQRARQQGWMTAYSPEVSIIHYEGGAGEWRSKNAFLYTMDSYRIYLCKHYGTIAWNLTRYLLAVVFFARGLLHGLGRMTGLDSTGGRKAAIYFSAIRRLLSLPLRRDSHVTT